MQSIHPFRRFTLAALGVTGMLAVWACSPSEPPQDPQAQTQQDEERSAQQRPDPGSSTTVR